MSDLVKCPKCKRYSDSAAESCDCGYSFKQGTFTEPAVAVERQALGGWRFLSLLVGVVFGSVAAVAKAGGFVVGAAVFIGYHVGDSILTQPLRRSQVQMPARVFVILGAVIAVLVLWVVAIALVDLKMRGGL